MTPTPPQSGDETAQRMPDWPLNGQRVADSRTDEWTPRGYRKKIRMIHGILHAAALPSSLLTGGLIVCRPVPVMARCSIGKRHARNAPASLQKSAVALRCPWLRASLLATDSQKPQFCGNFPQSHALVAQRYGTFACHKNGILAW
ncbi:MAG TPA: hypothetical protein VMP11_13485 [Verrucomicrobiae bacterium]|nr:hypothetical protein [Verrucomicrobiae bacterium]